MGTGCVCVVVVKKYVDGWAGGGSGDKECVDGWVGGGSGDKECVDEWVRGWWGGDKECVGGWVVVVVVKNV